MHRSRLGGLIIDCRTDDLEEAERFWRQALGLTVTPSDDPEDVGYVRFARPSHDLDIELQRVKHESRVHLDIETDDIEAEVARLQSLGAKIVSRVQTWCVMEAPTGHRFCVVSPGGTRFAEQANVWS